MKQVHLHLLAGHEKRVLLVQCTTGESGCVGVGVAEGVGVGVGEGVG